jgi:LAO/AO transport system kinase
LAAPTREAATALAPAFDIVVVETVGVGQSETDVEELCDTIAVVVQPASGDTLQFLKAGIMEVPDVLVVTKADLGDVAKRARRDLEQALKALGSSETPVLSVSSLPPPSGIDGLVEALDAHRDSLDLPAARLRSRRLTALAEFTAERGEGALRALGGRREAERFLADQPPELDVPGLVTALERGAGLHA